MKKDNFSASEVAKNGTVQEFQAEVRRILEHKMIAMPYSPVNDENGVILSQFSKVELPENLMLGNFRVFSSFCGTEDKDADLVGCEILEGKETKNSMRFRKLPKMLSITENGEKKDVYRMARQMCLNFYLPFKPTEFNQFVLTSDTSFSKVIDCMSADLYQSFLEQRGISDNPFARGVFLRVLDMADAMEFVERVDPYKKRTNFHQNSTGERQNMEKDEPYKEFYVVFHDFEEDRKTISAVYAKNHRYEKLVEERTQEKGRNL